MDTGWYREPVYPEVLRSSVDQLADMLVRDIVEGADGSHVPAGIIGEIGTEVDYLETPISQDVCFPQHLEWFGGVPLRLSAHPVRADAPRGRGHAGTDRCAPDHEPGHGRWPNPVAPAARRGREFERPPTERDDSESGCGCPGPARPPPRYRRGSGRDRVGQSTRVRAPRCRAATRAASMGSTSPCSVSTCVATPAPHRRPRLVRVRIESGHRGAALLGTLREETPDPGAPG